MSILVKKVNTLITVQDLGRFGYQAQGVPMSGAMDVDSFMNANMLVGNALSAACLEIATGNGEFLIQQNHSIAITGSGIVVKSGEHILPRNRHIEIQAGNHLTIKRQGSGQWSYIAVAGGLQLEQVLGSCSTYLAAHFGGIDGRALAVGDVIKTIDLNLSNFNRITDNEQFISMTWSILPSVMNNPIRLYKGPEWDWLSHDSKSDLTNTSFIVSSDSSRMGYRLKGSLLHKSQDTELISTAVSKGTVQLTPDGSLIVLMADAQTIGGYPRIAQVAAVDLGRLAQKRPGDSVQFEFISYEEACSLYMHQEKERIKTTRAIQFKLREYAAR